MNVSPLRRTALLAAVATLVGCASGAAPPAPSSATAPAPAAPAIAPNAGAAGPRAEGGKAASPPSMGQAPIFVAQERGYFAEEGISFEDPGLDTASSANFFPALATNQLDVAGGGITSALFNAINQGVIVRVALGMTTAPPGDKSSGLLVRKELVDSGRVHDLGDLRGLRAAFTSKGHSTEMFLDKALSQGGLTLDDLQTTPLAYQDMAIALSNNNLDVAVIIEPYAALAVQNGSAVRLRSW